LAGGVILYAEMVVEELGRRQNSRPYDGPGRGHLLRSREETKEEIVTRLFVGEPQVSQLVGLPVLPL